MNKKHTFKVCKLLGIACLVFTCATVLSCRDEYLLDDPGYKPTWLGESIYEELENGIDGNQFNYFLRIIDDVENGKYKEVLLRTGSKTLFVANDSAFMAGIKNEWGLDSYEQLNPGHKKIILFNAMLDNAYLLEMMSSTAAPNKGEDPTEGECLRQVTSAGITDTIYFRKGDELPQFNTHWDRFRETGLRLAEDGTQPMMVHFLAEQLQKNGISTEDLSVLVNRKDEYISPTDAFIFDKKVIYQNVTCINGYIHVLDGLLIPPSNMAEEIRTNGQTDLFSRMLDRFSVPVYNPTLTAQYNERYHENDDANAEIVYEKRYFTQFSNRSTYYSPTDTKSGFLSYEDYEGNKFDTKGSLLFSPGWNRYQSSSQSTPEVNMGVIFAPKDETLIKYFQPGGQGYPLYKRYCNEGELPGALDSIPLEIIQELVRNLMKSSFNESVPSKFSTLKNDASDDMKVKPEHVDSSIVANNGVVYVTNTVYSPAKYVAVSAPALLNENLSIVNKAIENNGYDSYLLAMGSRFSFIAPSNDGAIYYDPSTTYTSTPNEGEINNTHYAYKLQYNPQGNGSVYAFRGEYSPENPSEVTWETNRNSSATVSNALLEMLEYNIIVGNIHDGNKYHMAKGYGTVKVETEVVTTDEGELDTIVTHIWGGREIEEKVAGIRQNGVAVGERFMQENGRTYRMDEGMVHPATRSVYNILKDSPEDAFEEFFKLCDVPAHVIDYLKPVDENGRLKEGANDSINRYFIFHIPNDEGLDQNVRTFNTYHYTVYVPTNEAIDLAHTQGLPRWEEVEVLAEKHAKNDSIINDVIDKRILELQDMLYDDELTEAQKEEYMKEMNELLERDSIIKAENKEFVKKMKAAATLITNFVKYHIQDNSVYVDNKPFQVIEGNNVFNVIEYETAAMDDITKRFSKVTVQTQNNTISVKGDFDNAAGFDPTCYVMNTPGQENILYNIMARDIERSGSGNYKIETSSYAVVHQITNFLVNDRIYDAATETFIK